MNCAHCGKEVDKENSATYGTDTYCNIGCISDSITAGLEREPHPSYKLAPNLYAHLNMHCAIIGKKGVRTRGEYTCMQDFVLKNGQGFKAVDCAAEYREDAQHRQCYRNAFHLALAHGFIYVEGYAISVIPTLHAWCYDPATDRIIDPTWRYRPENEYIGVPIKTDYMFEICSLAEQYSVIDAWTIGWPIMSDPKEKWYHDLQPLTERA